MNRIPFLHTLFFASALLLACGCSSPEQPDVPDVPDTSVPLSISVSTCTGTPVSRTIVSETGTDAGQVDHIGVFLAAEDGYSSYADAAISSAVFTLQSDKSWKPSHEVNLQSKTASLYAWYPAKDKDGNLQLATTADKDKATRTIPIEVSATQTFDGASATACSQADYLYGLDKEKAAGTPTVIQVNNATGNTSPTIYLYHALSQVVFTIEYKATRLPDAEYDYVKSISLSGGSFRAGTGTMQLNDGTLAFTDASNATLTFAIEKGKDPKLPGNTGNPVAVAYGLVAPGTPGSNSAPVTVNLVLGQKGDDTNNRTLSATTTTWFSTPWEPGKIYTYHLLLDKNDLTFESVGIGDWTPQDKDETPMPPELGTRLTILAEIAGGESTTPATREVTSPSDPDANVYDRSTFIAKDKINVTCSRDGKAIASAGYELKDGKWTATEIGKGLGFLPAITCRAEFPVGYSSIAQDQSTPDAFLKSNLLRTREVPVSSAKVSFMGDDDALKHQNARLTLKFKGENTTLPEFSQLNVVGTGLRGGTTSESITLLRPVKTEYTWCAVISPRAEKTTINVTVTDENGVTYKATLPELTAVVANNHYTFTLKLQNNILVPVGGEITDWKPEVRYAGEFDKNTTE